MKINPYFRGYSDAHTIVCGLCMEDWNFPWYYWINFWPFNRQWGAYQKLNRVAIYLYEEFNKERWFEEI